MQKSCNLLKVARLLEDEGASAREDAVGCKNIHLPGKDQLVSSILFILLDLEKRLRGAYMLY